MKSVQANPIIKQQTVSGSTSKAIHKTGAPKQTKVKKETAKSGIAECLRDLFVDELKDVYWSEKELVKALPKIIKQATSNELISVLTKHLVETKEHVARLEEVFFSVGKKSETEKSDIMEGLLKETEEIMQNTEQGFVRDAGIICAAKKVEHYEIAIYGTLVSFAKTLQELNAASLLQSTLNEEKEVDQKLSEIAESFIKKRVAGKDYKEKYQEA
jgi:ferritin-like metal-binding protein YciE